MTYFSHVHKAVGSVISFHTWILAVSKDQRWFRQVFWGEKVPASDGIRTHNLTINTVLISWVPFPGLGLRPDLPGFGPYLETSALGNPTSVTRKQYSPRQEHNQGQHAKVLLLAGISISYCIVEFIERKNFLSFDHYLSFHQDEAEDFFSLSTRNAFSRTCPSARVPKTIFSRPMRKCGTTQKMRRCRWSNWRFSASRVISFEMEKFVLHFFRKKTNIFLTSMEKYFFSSQEFEFHCLLVSSPSFQQFWHF